MQPRELPLAIVQCCTRYVVSMLHPVPPCTACGQTPMYESETSWWLEWA